MLGRCPVLVEHRAVSVRPLTVLAKAKRTHPHNISSYKCENVAVVEL